MLIITLIESKIKKIEIGLRSEKDHKSNLKFSKECELKLKINIKIQNILTR